MASGVYRVAYVSSVAVGPRDTWGNWINYPGPGIQLDHEWVFITSGLCIGAVMVSMLDLHSRGHMFDYPVDTPRLWADCSQCVSWSSIICYQLWGWEGSLALHWSLMYQPRGVWRHFTFRYDNFCTILEHSLLNYHVWAHWWRSSAPQVHLWSQSGSVWKCDANTLELVAIWDGLSVFLSL